jgi:hypothetical protein
MLYYSLEVGSRVLRLLFGDLQLLFQGSCLLLRLTRHCLFHALDLLRSFDLGLQRSITGRGDLCVGIVCLSHQTYPSLRPLSK